MPQGPRASQGHPYLNQEENLVDLQLGDVLPILAQFLSGLLVALSYLGFQQWQGSLHKGIAEGETCSQERWGSPHVACPEAGMRVLPYAGRPSSGFLLFELCSRV